MFQKTFPMFPMKKETIIPNDMLLITESVEKDYRSVEAICEPDKIEELKMKLFGKTKEQMRNWMNQILEEEEWETMRIKDIVDFMEQQLLVTVMTEMVEQIIGIQSAYASEFHWVPRKKVDGSIQNGMSVKWLWSL